jgi:DNA-binding XRE family transcriptional regulator
MEKTRSQLLTTEALALLTQRSSAELELEKNRLPPAYRQVDTIREPRIACQRHMPYGTRGQVRRLPSRAAVFNLSDELRAWRHRNNLSQSEAALKLQVSKRTLQEWEQGRAEPDGLARSAVQKVVHRAIAG